MIKIENLSAGYNKEEILKGVSATFERGKISTIIGQNGCGKSTLLKTIIGYINIKNGDIFLDGNSIKSMRSTERAKKIAYLSQGKNIPETDVFSMVLCGRFPHLSYPRKYRKCDYEKAEEALERMGISHLRQKRLSELSGGIRQKVYIAMALCQETDVILLDEPTTYLDISQQFILFDILKELSEDGKTIITVMHDILQALEISDSIAIMNKGEFVFKGSSDEILETDVIERNFGAKIQTSYIDGIKKYFYLK